MARKETITVTFSSAEGSATSFSERGRRRRASPAEPYTLNVNARNQGRVPDYSGSTLTGFSSAIGINSTTAATIARNNIQITFANIAPTAQADGAIAAADNTAGNPLAIDVLSNDDDADSDNSTMTAELISDVPAGEGTLSVNGTGDGFLYVVPDTLPVGGGTTSFTYRPVDNEGATGNTVTVTVSIPAAAVTAAPVAQDDSFAIDEDTSLTGADVAADNGNGVDSDSDTASADLTFVTVNEPETGTLTFRADGTFDYVPDPDDVGGDDNAVSFDYTVSDGSSTDSARVTIAITPVNDTPVVTAIALADVTEAVAAFSQDLLDSDVVSDVDGDTLEASDIDVQITSPVEVDEAAAVRVAGSEVTITPEAFDTLDNDQNAEITITYTVSDGTETVENTLTQTIIGIDNGLGRTAGLYADTISARYNNHFGGTAQANGSCHTCHLPGQVSVDVDTRDECVQSPPVFNEYGLQLCLDRDATAPALSDLRRRMADAEPEYAPTLNAPAGIFRIPQSAARGTQVGDRLTAQPGRTVGGLASSIVTYLIVNGDTPSDTDASGQFAVSASGELSVRAEALVPGTYSFVVLPVNDAGQRDNAGDLVADIPGFYPVEATLQTSVTVEVLPEGPVAVDDVAATAVDTALTIGVTSNDTGGTPTSVQVEDAPANGSVTVSGALGLTYSPDAGFAGTDSFTYTAANDAGRSAPATVTVTVVSDGGVIAANDTASTLAARAVTVDVLDNDRGVVRTGAQATVVTISSAPPGAQGTATVDGQAVVFTPADGFSGEAQLTYRAENPGASGAQTGSEATLTVTVLNTGSGIVAAAVTDPRLRGVADAFEESCAATAGGGAEADAFLAACDQVISAAANGGELDAAMRALRNEEQLAVVDAAATVSRGLGNVIRGRLDRLRSGGARGFTLGDAALTIGGKSIPLEPFVRAGTALLGATGQDSAEAQMRLPNIGVFVSGEVALVERDANGNADGYDVLATNITAGADRSFGSGRHVGLALGYSTSQTDYSGGGGLDADGFQLALYGLERNALGSALTFEGLVAVGYMLFDSTREIDLSSTGGGVSTATASYDGYYLNLSPGLSYSQTLGRLGDPLGNPLTGLTLTWSGGLDYLLLNVGSYTEDGGGGLALSTEAETYQTLQLRFGLDARRPVFLVPGLNTELFGGLEVRGELLDDSRGLTASFAAAGPGAPSFRVSEDGTAGLGGSADIGLLVSSRSTNFDLSYGFDYDSGDRRAHRIGFGLSHRFFGTDSFNLGVAGQPKRGGCAWLGGKRRLSDGVLGAAQRRQILQLTPETPAPCRAFGA